MTKRETFAQALLKPINPAGAIILGVYTFVWGVWVANPFWTVFTQASLYSVMSSIAPEVFWGLLAMACGLAVIYGAVKRSYGAIIFGASVGGWHWFMIASFYLLGDIYNTGGITSLTFAIYAVFIYLNVKVNHKKHKTMREILHCEDD